MGLSAPDCPLQTAGSWESVGSQALFNESPTRKRKAPQASAGSVDGRRACSAGWGSPADSIDLASTDSLDEEDGPLDDCQAPGSHKTARLSTCSSSRSEDWSFHPLDGELRARSSFDLAAEPELANMTDSPTKAGDFRPQAVSEQTLVAATAHQYGFSQLCVNVGTTYFQRVAAKDRRLKQAAQTCPDFAAFVAGTPDLPKPLAKSVGWPLHGHTGAARWLLAVHLTCIYLAAKNLEVVPYKHLLRTMLSRLHGATVQPHQAEALELEVLTALEWRLGPYFLHRA